MKNYKKRLSKRSLKLLTTLLVLNEVKQLVVDQSIKYSNVDVYTLNTNDFTVFIKIHKRKAKYKVIDILNLNHINEAYKPISDTTINGLMPLLGRNEKSENT